MEFLTGVIVVILGIFGLAFYIWMAALTKGFCDALFKDKDVITHFLGIIWPIFWWIFFVAAIIFWLCKGIKKISTIAMIS